ncbi:MAG: DUF1015 domain-containing protein, partial [Actinomycetota bacterium]|nr:DUF1015 domain-containing protein [Actinomycetota bacterium]
MATIRPFDGWLVSERCAQEVPTPAHDAMSNQERRAHVRNHAGSYLRVERTVGDGVTDTGDAGLVLAEGRAALEDLLSNGAFAPSGHVLYLYRLEADGHTQTGIVAELSAGDIAAGAVRPHEGVSTSKAEHLARHFAVVGAQSSPILLGVRGRSVLEDQLVRLAERRADLIVDAGDGVRQSVWIIDDAATIRELVATVGREDVYVVDGHHRVAATTLYADEYPEDEHAQWTLAVLYPTSELRVQEYNRIVPNPFDVEGPELLQRLARHGQLVETDDP